MKIQIEGTDLLAAVQKQRDEAMDDAANRAAMVQSLLRQIAVLEAKLKEKDGNEHGHAAGEKDPG